MALLEGGTQLLARTTRLVVFHGRSTKAQAAYNAGEHTRTYSLQAVLKALTRLRGFISRRLLLLRTWQHEKVVSVCTRSAARLLVATNIVVLEVSQVAKFSRTLSTFSSY